MATTIRSLQRAARALDPATLTDWIAATEARIAAKVSVDLATLQRVIDDQQKGYSDGSRDERPSLEGRIGAAEEARRLGRQLEYGPRLAPHVAPLTPLFDDAARAQVVVMRRAGASYATIAGAFASYRGAPGRRGYEQIVHRAAHP